MLQRSCNKRPWRFFIIIHHSSYSLADFFCMFLLSFFYIMYIHALVTSSLQMRKISRHSRSKYKVTLRTRKRVKQMVFFYFFSFLRKECTYTYVSYVHMGRKYYEFSHKRATHLKYKSHLGLYRTSLSGPEVRQSFKVRTHQKPDVLLPGRRTFIT